ERKGVRRRDDGEWIRAARGIAQLLRTPAARLALRFDVLLPGAQVSAMPHLEPREAPRVMVVIEGECRSVVVNRPIGGEALSGHLEDAILVQHLLQDRWDEAERKDVLPIESVEEGAAPQLLEGDRDEAIEHLHEPGRNARLPLNGEQ